MKKNAKKCFISTSFSTSLSKLDSVIELVESMGMTPITTYDTSVGDSIVSTIADQMKSSDIVIVLFGDLENQQLYFELGMATALQKRVIVVYEGTSQPSLSTGTGTVVVHIDTIQELEKLEWALEMILSSPRSRKKSSSEISDSLIPLRGKAKEFLSRAEHAKRDLSTMHIVQLITDVLSCSGITTIVPSSGKDDGTDLVVWFDDKKTGQRVKLPIEVKKTISLNATRMVHSAMVNIDAPMALLIYLEGEIPKSVNEFGAGRIIFIKLEELIRNLEKNTLPKVLTQFRNDIVHRKSP